MIPSPILHRQGTLDGLCGVYCVVNACTMLLGSSVFTPSEMFKVLVRSLGKKIGWHISNGMFHTELESVLQCCVAYMRSQDVDLSFHRAFTEAPKSLNTFWATLQQHHRRCGDGSIILGLDGKHSHWTCVDTMDNKCIRLADSDHLTELFRDTITIGRATVARPTIIEAPMTYLLSLK